MYGCHYSRRPAIPYGPRRRRFDSPDRSQYGSSRRHFSSFDSSQYGLSGQSRRSDNYVGSDVDSNIGSLSDSEDGFCGGGGRSGLSRGYGGRSTRPTGRSRGNRMPTNEEIDAILDPVDFDDPWRSQNRSGHSDRVGRSSRQESPFGTQYDGAGRRLSSVSLTGRHSPAPSGRRRSPREFGGRSLPGDGRGSSRSRSDGLSWLNRLCDEDHGVDAERQRRIFEMDLMDYIEQHPERADITQQLGLSQPRPGGTPRSQRRRGRQNPYGLH